MRQNRKLEFIALLLPVAGLVLIMPPLVSIANAGGSILGFPPIIAFLFAVWSFLIAAAFILQHHLAKIEPGVTKAEQSDSGENDTNGAPQNDTGMPR